MNIIKLSYKAKNWELTNLALRDVNLIVGKNATGKSRTLLTIDFLYRMITQKAEIEWEVKWNIVFKSEIHGLITFAFDSKIVDEALFISEEVIVNDETVLKRDGKTAILKNYITEQFDEANPPDNKLVIHVNRDVKKYPYLEAISIWAENSYGFKFGNVSPIIINDLSKRKKNDYDLFNSINSIAKLFKNIGKESTSRILSDLKLIGYKNIYSLIYIDNIFSDDITVLEDDINMPISYSKLSQGMFRALSVLIFVEYLVSRNTTATIVIDDLCEGLDYERATKLGEIVFNRCQENDIQLIATSNDMFLMDVIDIKNWNVLTRHGKKVTALNVDNSPELFDNFKYTGLSNFDFFSSDYINKRDI